MITRPGWPLLGLSLRRSAELGVLLVGLVWVGSQVESGEAGLSYRTLIGLLAPVAAASGTAMALAEMRKRGDWSAWEGFGYSAGRQLRPLLLLLVFGLALQAQLSVGGQSSSLQLPPPISPAATGWPGIQGSGSEELAGCQRPPGELGWRELLRRRRSGCPEGARVGVDQAEFIRRFGWLLAWPIGLAIATGLGMRVPLVHREGRSYGPLAAGVLSGLSTVGWCLAVLVASAAAAAW